MMDDDQETREWLTDECVNITYLYSNGPSANAIMNLICNELDSAYYKNVYWSILSELKANRIVGATDLPPEWQLGDENEDQEPEQQVVECANRHTQGPGGIGFKQHEDDWPS